MNALVSLFSFSFLIASLSHCAHFIVHILFIASLFYCDTLHSLILEKFSFEIACCSSATYSTCLSSLPIANSFSCWIKHENFTKVVLKSQVNITSVSSDFDA